MSASQAATAPPENAGAGDPPAASGVLSKSEPSKWNLESIGLMVAELAEKMENRVLTFEHKNAIIDRQYEELKQYREGIVQHLLKPIFMDLIRLHDDFTSLLRELSRKETQQTADAVLKPFSTIPQDILDILNRNDVESFEEPAGTLFDAARQKVIGKVVADSAADDRAVAESIRPGFTWNGRVIRPQMVNVRVFSAPAEPPEKQSPGGDHAPTC